MSDSRMTRYAAFVLTFVVVLAFMSIPVQASGANNTIQSSTTDAAIERSEEGGAPNGTPGDGGTDRAISSVNDAPTGTADKKVKKSAVDMPGSVAELVATVTDEFGNPVPDE